MDDDGFGGSFYSVAGLFGIGFYWIAKGHPFESFCSKSHLPTIWDGALAMGDEICVSTGMAVAVGD